MRYASIIAVKLAFEIGSLFLFGLQMADALINLNENFDKS